ncbi:hypothetical protein OGM63_23185 [Plectonema radiosum NIES-515]|uniref:HEAT repeat domain-containing protein n=1 Tax=Plectonema radiosum NIES-515 TaxID=2986073 RepID=A0ABT3B4S3_9CYAN|nr:hypothetical protein [Plectonema radiosum]MCV3216380.1 hypothetical protein [Plectonema radiosum NIES-515]
MNPEKKKRRINELIEEIKTNRSNEGSSRLAIDELTEIGEPNQEAVDAVLDSLRWWFNWGDYDNTYLAILHCLGVIGLGNQNAVDALERSMHGNTWPKAAMENLRKLAQNGDIMAQSVLNKDETRNRLNKL